MKHITLQELRRRIGQPQTTINSPLSLWLSGIISDAAPGRLAVKYVVRREMTDEFGFLHLGIISTMAEETIGLVVHTLDLEVDSESANLSIQFHERIELAQVVTSKATIEYRDGKRLYACCTLHDRIGRHVATARSVLSIRH